MENEFAIFFSGSTKRQYAECAYEVSKDVKKKAEEIVALAKSFRYIKENNTENKVRVCAVDTIGKPEIHVYCGGVDLYVLRIYMAVNAYDVEARQDIIAKVYNEFRWNCETETLIPIEGNENPKVKNANDAVTTQHIFR